MALERFQSNTVEAAVRALADEGGSRRFLIADEVGLGKTISSRAVAQRLRAFKDGPFNVVYLCPNLDIASQNLSKLAVLDDRWETPPDRLSLAAAMTGKETVRDFRLFSYTPDTSLPGWKAGQRGGRVAERELVAALTSRVARRFWKALQRIDDRRERDDEVRHFGWKSSAPKHLVAPFRSALVEVLGLADVDLDAELRAWLRERGDDVPEYILRARAALAMVALRRSATRPDLLILDEFHRYADLVLPDESAPLAGIKGERQETQRLLVRTMFGEVGDHPRPALLLMSATPYRLLRVDGTEVEVSRYRSLMRLVRFLYGDQRASAARDASDRIAEHHRALGAKDVKEEALARVEAAKRDVEAALRPIIARTERATTIKGELFDRRRHAAVVEADDLRVFRHFAEAVSERRPDMSGWVTTLWSSVPYPAETLFEYKASEALSDVPAIGSSRPTAKAAHPQVRALVKADLTEAAQRPAPVELPLLSLPWMPPTAPWWTLGGPWAKSSAPQHPVGKALIFSRFVATPLALGALLSLDVRRRQPPSKTAQPYLRFEAKTPWPLIATFMPWPNLVQAIDPARNPGKRASDAIALAAKALADWLGERGFGVARRGGADRKPWELAFEIEAALNRMPDVVEALRVVSGLPSSARRSWLRHNQHHQKGSFARSEIQELARWLLASPGMVVGRTLARHQSGLLAGGTGLNDAFAFCWRDLRPYLGQRAFGSVVLPGGSKRKNFPDALRTAILTGGLEAVLDEHLAVMDLVGDATPLEHLRQAIFGRAGRVRMRRGSGRKPASVSVHAAVPYAGAERGKSKVSKEGKLRSDSLRRAFNSPFWPHVLATTSVGQEGLDFHVWCDRIVHWDLPRDPVDFEQREGRIARYASLCVRRALVDDHASAGVLAPTGASPFGAIIAAARRAAGERDGLERWWSPPTRKPISVTFDVRFSQNATRLRSLQEDLTRYRLALGQPEPTLFEDMIKHFDLKPGQARELALDLSAPNVDPIPAALTETEAPPPGEDG